MEKTILGVDTGNKLIKTISCIFNAGLSRFGTTPPTITEGNLFYNGEYYCESPYRTYQNNNKTVDDTYFLLTLIAIARELIDRRRAKKADVYAQYEENIVLGVGLPPDDLSWLKDDYEEYFSKEHEPIVFKYDDKKFRITIDKVFVYPQAFAALAVNTSLRNKSNQLYLCDIGGYTTDIVPIFNQKIVKAGLRSYEYGMIQLYDMIQHEIKRTLHYVVKEDTIEDLINGNASNENGKEIAKKCVQEYSERIIGTMLEGGADLRTGLLVVVGGGNKIIKLNEANIIKKFNIGKPEYIDDICANAKGYESLTKAMLEKNKK